MNRRLFSMLALAAMCVATAIAPATAHAGKYDVDLNRLGTRDAMGVVTKDDAGFRSLASELGTVIAARPMDPGDTLGLSGFAVSADVGITTIRSGRTYWQNTADSPQSVVPSLQVFGRKGLWPGIEIGAGASHVFDSSMWGLSGYAKFALHEGFHHLPIPTIALRGMVTELLGSKDLRMTQVGIDGQVSHVFGAGSTFSITPYVGYQALLTFARSTVLDATPGTDEYPDGFDDPPPGDTGSSEFVFDRQSVIVRHRPFVGVRFIFAVLRFGVEGMVVPGGKSKDKDTDAADRSGLQGQVMGTLGFDF
jgi:hypothetical protein